MPSQIARSDEYRAFEEIYRTEWAWRQGELGGGWLTADEPLDPKLPDVSVEAQQRRERYWQEIMNRLDRVDRGRLGVEEAADYDVYRYQISVFRGRQRFKMYERPANADSAFWMELTSECRRRLESAADAETYAQWLGEIPRYIDQNITNMRAGVRRGFGPAQVSMIGREATIRSVAQAPSAESSVFFQPLAGLPETVADHDQWRKVGAELIKSDVIPAYQRLLSFFTDEYFPALPTDIAARNQPDGNAFYAAQLYEYATTDLTAEEIHRIGLDAVASIRAEMAEVAGSAGFIDADAMLRHMRTDPSFYETTATGLLRFTAWQAKQFDARAHHYFGRLPRMRFGIEEPPPELAPFYTFGRGGPHRYVLNTYNLPARPLYSIPALTLHEAAPGHAFQVPFALEMTQHPDYRRKDYISAFGEGWALYTERLGVEMGMYETPFEMMGMLSFQMWRAVRLVIDPGMHALGWTREQAQDYLRDNTAISDHEIVTEVDRYIAWPGQATAYYLGMLKIMELRRRAESALSESFSIRSFHDQVLALGSVPLPVLETAIDQFISNGGRSPFED
ncbi:MAG TPA: DUF885 family protein [Microlunatus sp.]